MNQRKMKLNFSFFNGMARSIDLFGLYDVNKDLNLHRENDEQSLLNDIKVIGNDFKIASEKLNEF